MNETTEQVPEASTDDSDWLISPEPSTPPAADAPPRPGRRAALAAAGLVAAGALVGGVGVSALRSNGSTPASPAAFTNGQLPNGQLPNGQLPNGQLPNGQLPNGQLPDDGSQDDGFAGGPGGGVAGEQRIGGTVTAVHASSLTIRSASGTASYAVTSQTQIVRNGALASLSAVRAGDNVFVHLIPGSGSSYVVERLFAQSGASSSGATGSGSTGSTT